MLALKQKKKNNKMEKTEHFYYNIYSIRSGNGLPSSQQLINLSIPDPKHTWFIILKSIYLTHHHHTTTPSPLPPLPLPFTCDQLTVII